MDQLLAFFGFILFALGVVLLISNLTLPKPGKVISFVSGVVAGIGILLIFTGWS